MSTPGGHLQEAVAWMDDQLRENPALSVRYLMAYASQQFGLAPGEVDYLRRRLEGRFRVLARGGAWAISRSTGQRLLGLLWLIDGVLQLSPGTTRTFIHIITSNGRGQPDWLHGLLLWGAQILAPHAAAGSTLLAVAEIGLGLLLVVRLHPRWVLAGTILLSVPIWIWGQALGGILTGSATDVGAMPLYILVAVLVWPAREASNGQTARQLKRGETGGVDRIPGGAERPAV